MARNQFTCDVCKKPTDEIVAKLHYTPLHKGSSKETQYTHHADVGSCCATKVLQVVAFRKRMSAEQYHASRRKRSGGT